MRRQTYVWVIFAILTTMFIFKMFGAYEWLCDEQLKVLLSTSSGAEQGAMLYKLEAQYQRIMLTPVLTWFLAFGFLLLIPLHAIGRGMKTSSIIAALIVNSVGLAAAYALLSYLMVDLAERSSLSQKDYHSALLGTALMFTLVALIVAVVNICVIEAHERREVNKFKTGNPVFDEVFPYERREQELADNK